MDISAGFLLTSAGLGIGLAMDAFSVSLANGLSEPSMRWRKMGAVAGVFAFFQALMPVLGWLCVHTILQYFGIFEKFIPYIALSLLGFIGGKMIYEGIKGGDETEVKRLTVLGLLVQGVATSIDALSVGFTIAGYNIWNALLCAGIISLITFVLCFAGIIIGKNIGTKIGGKATIIGGVILVAIGLEIFITSFL